MHKYGGDLENTNVRLTHIIAEHLSTAAPKYTNAKVETTTPVCSSYGGLCIQAKRHATAWSILDKGGLRDSVE
jgi:hypothetical protein